MTETSSQFSPATFLERRITLAELVDQDSFREVMRSFADIYRVGVKVFDVEGNKIVDVRVASGPFCSYLFEHAETRRLCTTLVASLRNATFDEENGVERAKVVDCFSGLRYILMPIHYDGDLMGRLIFGPFLPMTQAGPHERLVQIEPKLSTERLVELLRPVRQAPDELVDKVLDQLQKIVSVILFTSYRAMLTSQMHIESVTSSYQELQDKNRSLREANQRLQELDQLKSNFLATVSHELRTPLTSIIGYSEMLLEGMAGAMNDEQRQYLTTVMEKGESLLGMISQILDLSRIESGNLQLQKVHFDIGAVCAQCTTSIKPQARKKNIAVDVDIAEGLPIFHGDKEKIGQIVVNLLGNAVKFTPQGGRISLHVTRFRGQRPSGILGLEKASVDTGETFFGSNDEDFVLIVVQDTGIGIPNEKLKRIWDRFFQVDNSSTREHGGTGLGLSIVKSFIEGHDGVVDVQSDVGVGTTFSVYIPVLLPS